MKNKLILSLIISLLLTTLFVMVDFLSGFLGFPMYICFWLYSLFGINSSFIYLIVIYIYMSIFTFLAFTIGSWNHKYLFWIILVVVYMMLNIARFHLSGIGGLVDMLLQP